ncbi:MAG: metallophosphoesterase [Planctomycetes bacterium]|nr:metallophosphoesterase [Planctomycetota bacterium]
MRKKNRRLAPLLGLWALPAVAPAADEPHIGPYIQALRHDSVQIRWETEARCVGEVEAGESGGAEIVAKEVEPRQLHEVSLGGLRADTLYTYRVKWDGKTSARYSFRTMPPEGSRRFRLAAYGDSRTNAAVHAEVARGILAADPDIVVHTGDLVGDGTKREQWKPQFFDPARQLMARKPVVTCLGNHENDSSLYYELFHYPGNEAWFSHRWANVHFIVLDSQKPYEPGSEQHRWLEKELSGSGADWRVVFFHHPMFSCHPTRPVNANRWAWQDLFDRGRVDIVLTGHDHYYHRSHRIGRAWDPKSEGVYHITTAGGGASLYPVEEKVYSARAISIHHFLTLDFDGRRATGTAVGTDGTVIDRFTIDRTRPESTPLVSYEVVLWEKALRDAVEKVEPALLGAGEQRIERRFELPPPFAGPATVHCRWTGGSSFWAAGACEALLETAEGQPLVAAIWGEGPVRAMYPVPRLEVSLLKGPPGGREILNRTVRLEPVRLSANGALAAARLPAAIRVDGKLDEPAWTRATAAGGFTRDFGRVLSERETALVGHDELGIVVALKARTLLEKPLEKGATARDARHMYRTDEGLTVVLSAPSLIPMTYLFCANARGTRFDSLTGLLAWDPEWEFAASEVPGGWHGEMRIPWRALRLERPPTVPWRINVFRSDTQEKALSEWAPTFSAYGTSRKHDARLEFEGAGG